MEIGPFSVNDVNSIKELFESKKIKFSFLIDKEAEEEILNNFNYGASRSPRHAAGKLDLKTIYLEISESDFEKVKDELEKYGVVPLSDGSYELGDDS